MNGKKISQFIAIFNLKWSAIEGNHINNISKNSIFLNSIWNIEIQFKANRIKPLSLKELTHFAFRNIAIIKPHKMQSNWFLYSYISYDWNVSSFLMPSINSSFCLIPFSEFNIFVFSASVKLVHQKSHTKNQYRSKCIIESLVWIQWWKIVLNEKT